MQVIKFVKLLLQTAKIAGLYYVKVSVFGNTGKASYYSCEPNCIQAFVSSVFLAFHSHGTSFDLKSSP